MKRPFTKPATTHAEQVALLRQRGMVIDDPAEAECYLRQLNYYRLGAYWLPFEADHAGHRFRPGTRFSEVLNLYVFDRELRLLVLDAHADRDALLQEAPGEVLRRELRALVRVEDLRLSLGERRKPLWVDNPRELHERGYFPAHLLRPEDISGEIIAWCQEALGDNPAAILPLYKRIEDLRGKVKEFNLPFLMLPVSTPQAIALDVFIKMNTSASPLLRKYVWRAFATTRYVTERAPSAAQD